MKPTLLALTALLLLSGLSGPVTAAPAPRVSWRNWDRGIEEARGSGRPVLVDVYTDWCGWCRRMEADVYSRPEVRDYLSRKFVAIKLDAEAPDPARYEGRTFYQASFGKNDTLSILQVVENPGWLLPYISCVLVTLGLLVHFGIAMRRSTKRRQGAQEA